MMKIIIPMAKPETVSVSQDEGTPMAKKPRTTSTGTSNTGNAPSNRSARLTLAKVGL
ncbi:hypothetical protein [Leisingera caerulea]|uniref:hypothetical protein n=1 Tax=Leisingera caerulea TaxID=506591 RepID=UPI0021A35D9D|nr:hypothetical protein [Leisingera caerulea]